MALPWMQVRRRGAEFFASLDRSGHRCVAPSGGGAGMFARLRRRRALCRAVNRAKEFVMPSAKKAAPAAKKAAAPAKAAVQATVTLKHLAASLSDSHDLPKKQAEAMLGDLVT